MEKKYYYFITILFCITLVSATYNFRTIYNPHTLKLDYYTTSNMSGENITADYIFGISNSSDYWDNLNTINTTQLEDSNSELNIKESWISSLWCKLTGCTMTGDLDMSSNNIFNVSNYTGEKINVTCCVYLGTIQATDGNSISVKPSGDEDNFFSFKTIANRPTIKIEGGKFMYMSSSNIYDMGISLRADDTYSGTLNYEKDTHMMTMLGKNSPLGFKSNSEYNNYLVYETYDHQPQFSVFNGTKLKINDSLEVIGNINATENLTNTNSWFLGKTAWATIQDKFITAVDDLYIYMSGTTATLNETKLNLTIQTNPKNWTYLQNYPSACPSGSALTQLGDTITCTDSWVNIDGDTMTGNLIVNSNFTVDGTDFFVNSNNGNVGIGTTAPDGILHTAKASTGGSHFFDVYSANTGDQPMIYLRKSTGTTIGTPTVTGTGEELGRIDFQGVNTAGNFDQGARIYAKQNGVAAANMVPTDLTFETYGDSSLNTAQLVLHHDGNVGIGTTAPVGKLNVIGDANITGALYSGCPSGMVKVGSFCIDKYEAYLVSGSIGNTNGNDTTAVAGSALNQVPLVSITWFQANQACGNAGKRLCSNDEWQMAAAGTPDPHSADPADDSEPCNIWTNSKPSAATWSVENQAIKTGTATSCVSRWAVFDMSGNVWEWTADWAGMDPATDGLTTNAAFGSDYMYDVRPASSQGTGANFPAAFIRGGHWHDGAGAGSFALLLNAAPSNSNPGIGFRCCS